MITPTLCRAARVLLGWKQDDLAKHSEVGVAAIRRFEGGKTTPHRTTLKALQTAVEDAGIEFVIENGKGVGVKLAGLDR